jgi:hypothetical protein
METMEGLSERLEALEHQTRAVERRLHCWRGIAYGVVVLSLLSWSLPSGEAQVELSAKRKRSLAERVEALEHKLVHVTGDANEVVITGANLRIVNGLGTTDTTNGLGNLIVGYNEMRQENPDCPRIFLTCTDTRTGSHNVVVGQEHNFSRFGGVVGNRASVSAGANNVASGFLDASVSGGENNIASGNFSSVSGGSNRTAPGGDNWAAGPFFAVQ